jgi:class 3 adenylate cyclase
MHLGNKFAHRSDDTEELAFIKQLIFLVSLSCCVCGLLWSFLYCIVFGWGLTAVLPLSFVVIVGSAMLISHRQADHRLLVYAQLFCITWISALIQWSIGSIDHSGLVIAWSFLGPLGAMIFLTFRQSLIWIAMFLVIVVVSAAFQPALLGHVLEVSDTEKTIFYIMNIGVSSSVVFMASAWFVNTIQFERGRVNQLLQRIKALFGQHVSTEVAQELISNDVSGSESKSYEATIMFLDIRDFTLFADSKLPNEVAAFQNIIFGEYINLVREHKGIVLQILGDGILAVFGAPIVTPNHPLDAVQAGYEMIHKTKHLSETGQVPEIKIGIGLHTGKVLAGEIGNQYRKSYSITGSNVIVAARIEQLNKQFKSQFLVSETVYDQIKANEYDITFQGSHELKGISRKIGIYQLA